MNSEPGVIDSHAHFWDRSRFDYRWLDEADPALSGTFLPEGLLANGVDVAGIVFVQADCRADQAGDEAAWVNGLADAGAPIQAIVAGAGLERGAAAATELTRLSVIRRVTGVRRLLQDEPAGFCAQPDLVDGVRLLAEYGFSMDLCIRQRQLPEATALVAQVADVQFVLDHLGKPRISDSAFDEWQTDIARLAAHPNVSCKLSGLMTEAPAGNGGPELLIPWVRHAIEVFGPARCLFGSDWPVLTTAGSYDDWHAIVTEAMHGLSPSEAQRIMRGTALERYPSRV